MCDLRKGLRKNKPRDILNVASIEVSGWVINRNRRNAQSYFEFSKYIDSPEKSVGYNLQTTPSVI